MQTEHFFRTLREELTDGKAYETVEDLRYDLFEYVEVFCNRERLHSKLGYLSPADYDTRRFVRYQGVRPEVPLQNGKRPTYGHQLSQAVWNDIIKRARARGFSLR
ncbi:MAG: IS3 family transposase [Acidobacteriota bacterium]|nr:MAG: IS3 family transposase [Acidobacteriota bacterium]